MNILEVVNTCDNDLKTSMYYGESHILRNVSFHIEAGQVACVMGRNGVGKSTTLKAIMGLLPVRSGQVVLTERILRKPDRSSRQAWPGVCAPGTGDHPPSRCAKTETGILGARNVVQRHDRKAAFDEVYTLFPSSRKDSRAAGRCAERREQQQLAIGRAILSNPKVLLLDEPTEGIQPSIVDQIEDVIIGFQDSSPVCHRSGRTGLHFAARLADSCVVMAKGSVMAAGKKEELSAKW